MAVEKSFAFFNKVNFLTFLSGLEKLLISVCLLSDLNVIPNLFRYLKLNKNIKFEILKQVQDDEKLTL